MDDERMTTAEVVVRLQQERARLLSAVEAIGPRASTAFVTEDGGWTAQDVLAHLIHYAGQIAFGLGAPEKPPAYVVGVSERLTDHEWNERAVAHWRNFTLDDVRSEFERVVDRLIEFAAKRTDDQMNVTGAIEWAGERPLWQFIGTDTFLYEWPAHTHQIENAARIEP
jgi:Mycothiol maleylpyruvate isomerase N-terminal domain